MRAGFTAPPVEYRPMPFVFTTGKDQMSQQRTEELVRQAKESGFGGLGIIPGGKPQFLSEEYFQRYGEVIAACKKNGLEQFFYDTPGFPSGLGVDFYKTYREYSMRRLDMVAQDVAGPAPCQLAVPNGGVVMAAVAMNTKTFQRLDLTDKVTNNALAWDAPDGSWKVMLFVLVEQRGEGLTQHLPDYLNPEACDKFIEASHGRHAKQFPDAFGKSIRWAFFDDVALYYTKMCRTWTRIFNDEYKKKYNESPALLYPALWMDIGPDTEQARVRLHGLRAELFAEGWPRRVNEWCRAHGVQAMGHPAGNYQVMPVDLTGDMIEFYRHAQIPLLDMIFGMGGKPGYKIISSAAANFDRPLTAAEVFGGFNYKDRENFNTQTLYHGTLECFARGVNLLVPHAIWYEPQNMNIPPLISAENPKIAADLPDYNAWAARCMYLLRGGRTVADIAVLYPIAAMQGFYHFDNGTKYGQYAPKEIDYQNIGNCLTTDMRRDFTFVHPRTLAEKCSVKGKTLHLDNKENFQDYRLVVIPAGKVLSAAALRKVRDFWAAGGMVLATGVLPEKSAEFGKDAEVTALVKEIFGSDGKGAANPAGGRSVFVPSANLVDFKKAVAEMLPAADITFAGEVPTHGNGAVTALHKVKDNQHIYFFANTTDKPLEQTAILRDAPSTLESWDPHTGTIQPVQGTRGEGGMRVALKVPPYRSVFLVGR